MAGAASCELKLICPALCLFNCFSLYFPLVLIALVSVVLEISWYVILSYLRVLGRDQSRGVMCKALIYDFNVDFRAGKVCEGCVQVGREGRCCGVVVRGAPRWSVAAWQSARPSIREDSPPHPTSASARASPRPPASPPLRPSGRAGTGVQVYVNYSRMRVHLGFPEARRGSEGNKESVGGGEGT